MPSLLSPMDFERLRGEKESRRVDLLRQIESARAELDDIEDFLSRLAVTEQFLSVVSGDGETDVSRERVGERAAREPSLPEMIAHVLNLDLFRSASGEKARGLKPSEITSEINRIFAELADRRAVNAHVWYLHSKGRVKKNGMKYYLVQAGLLPTLSDPLLLGSAEASERAVFSEANTQGVDEESKGVAAE